jgi:hypothetical protein
VRAVRRGDLERALSRGDWEVLHQADKSSA